VVQGQCFNAGLELVLAADIVITADNARFAFHEIQFGVYPFGGGLIRLIRAAGWNTAMRYALTGSEFGALEALGMNVVAQVCPLAEAEAAGKVLATTISNKAPLAVQAALAQAQTWADRGEAAALAHSVPDIIRLLSSADASRGRRPRAGLLRKVRRPIVVLALDRTTRILRNMTELLEKALEAARKLPSETQDDIARVVLQLAGADETVVTLSDDERAAIEASKEAAARGEFATEEQVRATWAKHGL
jgi:Enoyl-CoA hydratase/isomerase